MYFFLTTLFLNNIIIIDLLDLSETVAETVGPTETLGVTEIKAAGVDEDNASVLMGNVVVETVKLVRLDNADDINWVCDEKE